MVLTYRKAQNLQMPGDLYLEALIAFTISKSGKRELDAYFDQAGEDDPFYQRARALKERIPPS